MKLGVLGFGNMASSIIIGNKDKFDSENLNLYILDKNFEKEAKSKLNYNECESNLEVVKNSDIILLGLKPQYLLDVLEEIKSEAKNKAFIWIGVGFTQNDLQKILPDSRILRVMPNLACKVQKSITIISKVNNLYENELTFAKNLFDSVGSTIVLDEKLIPVAGTVSGCTPAFLAMFVESLVDGAVLKGLAREDATYIAIEALIGSLEYIKQLNILPADLKGRVCSPGGTTISGVNALEKNNFRYATMQSIIEAVEKTENMTKK